LATRRVGTTAIELTNADNERLLSLTTLVQNGIPIIGLRHTSRSGQHIQILKSPFRQTLWHRDTLIILVPPQKNRRCDIGSAFPIACYPSATPFKTW
jgi:hypothetical protein